MKLLALPRGKPNTIKGSMVNVPVNVTAVASSLPKTAAILPLKLKRKLQYKGHVIYQNIRPRKVLDGFAWLKENNHLYKDIDKNHNWEEEAQQEDKYLWDKLTNLPSDSYVIHVYRSLTQFCLLATLFLL